MRCKGWFASLAVLLWLCIPVAVARAQSGVRVIEDACHTRFAQRLTFTLVAEADQTIAGITLYYRRANKPVTIRIQPEFTPGPRVQVRYEKDLERGEIPPGSVIEHYWRLVLADGEHIETDLSQLVYEDDRFAWQVVQAGRLQLHYYGSPGTSALNSLLERGQNALARLEAQAGVTLELPVRIYLYANSDDMAAALAPRSEGYDEQVVTLGVAVDENVLLLLGDRPDAGQTLAHELSHIVVGLATRNPYAPLPRWLDEGLAMHAEGEGLPASHRYALQEAINSDRLISVRSLSSYSGDPSQVNLYYAEVYSLVDYLLRTYGRESMRQLLAVFKEGSDADDALQQVYGLTVDELDTHWRESLGLPTRSTSLPVSTSASGPPPRRQTGLPCAAAILPMLMGAAVVILQPRPVDH
ncbi:MAG: peptidase MA family metallohydrolase [Anaerolineae bacterium]